MLDHDDVEGPVVGARTRELEVEESAEDGRIDDRHVHKVQLFGSPLELDLAVEDRPFLHRDRHGHGVGQPPEPRAQVGPRREARELNVDTGRGRVNEMPRLLTSRVNLPASMPETWPPASSRTAFSTFMGILIERAKSFEVPNGIMPSTAGVAMTAFATAPTVPSPPAATTIGGGEPLRRKRSGRRARSSTAISAATSSPLSDIARRARAIFFLCPACGLITRINRMVPARSASDAEDG